MMCVNWTCLIPEKGDYKTLLGNMCMQTRNDLLETKNMIPAAKERLNLSKAEKWAKERIPAMIPAKHDMADRIMKARVAFQ